MRPVDPRLLRQARPARRFLAATVLAGLVSATLVITQAQLLATAITHLDRGWAGLRTTLLVLLAVTSARAVVAYVVEVSALRAAATVRSGLRARLAAAVVRGGPGWLAHRGSGELVTLATRGLDALDDYFARYLPQLVLACVVPVAVLVRIAGADLISAVFVAVTLPLIPLFLALVGLHTRARTTRQWRALALLGGHFLDVVQGLATLAIFNRTHAQADVIRQISERHRRATMETLRVAFLSSLVLELLATLSTALVAVEVGLRLLGGHLHYQTALLVLLLAPEAFLPLRAVGTSFHAGMEGATAVAEVLDVAESTSSATVTPTSATCDLRRDTIELHDVSVSYADRWNPAVDRISLRLEPGAQLTVVGLSGAGKSTLLGLLLRQVDPTAGAITVGGVDLADVGLDGWRRQVAWVPQQPYLFAGTVAGNIRLGCPGATDGRVRRAAELAGLDLPRGVGTLVEEGGASLSSGQRQRVALARAFVLDAPLVLLDEPTAHLDDAAAEAVRACVRDALGGRTVVVVTHDRRWDDAERVVALDAGRLIDPAVA